jgi:hypothetical protein
MQYILRINTKLKERWDAVAPSGTKSGYVNEALETFLELPRQVLMARPRVSGRGYSQVCLTMDEDLKARVQEEYPKVSLAVVLQASIAHSLDEKTYLKMPKLIANKTRLGGKGGMERSMMRTRLPNAKIKRLKRIADDPLYGTVRKVTETAVLQFFESSPWEDSPKVWQDAEVRSAPGWSGFNVVVSKNIEKQIRDFAGDNEICIMTVLHSALSWWLSTYAKGR